MEHVISSEVEKSCEYFVLETHKISPLAMLGRNDQKRIKGFSSASFF
jgi:hypothetical protein